MRLRFLAVALLAMAMPLSTNAQQNAVPEIAAPLIS